MNSITLNPVGVVRSTRTEPADDHWDVESVRVEIDPAQFSPEALTGLTAFSHVEILFFMDRIDPGKVEKSARHPRNNSNWPKVGIFSQRGKNRPNQLGVTICKLVSVDGLVVHVEGLDAIDGSPVLDLKPWVAEFGPRGPVTQPTWISELMREYWRP